MRKRSGFFTLTQIIVLGFLGLILLGGLLLSLPVSGTSGESTPFLDALFTSTSATCVTGLVVYDTLTHWSVFGQIVILVLIQIGGLGFMTVMTLFSMLMRRQIGLRERMLLVQSAGGMELAGIVRLIRRILFGTLLFEGAGAVLLSIRFVQDFGWGEGLYKSVFTSISAFCNAGFDLLGNSTSLAPYADDPLVLIPIMLLILIGGIGFLVWNDLYQFGFRFSKYSLHTKLVLTASAVLVLGGAVLFFALEQNHVLAGKPLGEQVLGAFFLSVTPRTAGFATVDYAALSEPGYLLTLLWMMICGSAGSTAGGLKITTVLVLLFDAVAAVRQMPQITVFKRRIEEKMVRQATAVALVYLAILVYDLVQIWRWEDETD